MEELPAGVRAAMAMANGNRPTMTAEVVAVEEVQEKTVFVVKVSTAHDSYNSGENSLDGDGAAHALVRSVQRLSRCCVCSRKLQAVHSHRRLGVAHEGLRLRPTADVRMHINQPAQKSRAAMPTTDDEYWVSA